MVTYKETIKIAVYVDDKFIGNIVNVDGGYQFIPTKNRERSKVYSTLSVIKYKIEQEDYYVKLHKEKSKK